MMAALAGAGFALGLMALLRGAFPGKPTLAERLAAFNEHELAAHVEERSALTDFAVTLLETVKGEEMDTLRSDLDVTGITVEDAAIERLRAGVAGVVFGFFGGSITGIVSGALGLGIAALIAGVVGYHLPDMDLRKKAAARRLEFTRTLTAFITLLGSSISGGGGLSTALDDAAAMGQGWVFVHLRNTLDEAKLAGTSPWVALDLLGRHLRVTSLVELAGSLTLAGSSGARVTDTLAARAESARSKEIADIRSEAEAKSSTLGMPVGLMLLAWAVFMGYPAIMNILAS